MRELLSNNSLFVGQLYEDKSLALRARDLVFFTTDLQIITQQFTAGTDLFLKQKQYCKCFIVVDQLLPILVPATECHKQSLISGITVSNERSGILQGFN